jgi:hypothetical protein
MFGHDDINPQQDNQGGMPLPEPDATAAHGAATATDDAPAHPDPVSSLPPADADDDDDAETPEATTSAPATTDTDDEVADSAGDYIMTDAPQITPAATPAPAVSSSASAAAPVTISDDLLDIKQGALQQLTPLLGHLDQTAEEKFRTTMMMIQASDNQDLLKTAYEAAQQIEDEKTRAQALLDVVNEINYFTQQGTEGGQEEAGQDSL